MLRSLVGSEMCIRDSAQSDETARGTITRTVENVGGACGAREPARHGGAAVKNGNVADAEDRAVRRAASTRIEETGLTPVHPARTDGRLARHTGSWPVTSDAHADNPGYGRNA